MKKGIRQFIHRHFWWTYRPIKNIYRKHKNTLHREEEMRRFFSLSFSKKSRIFYLGITEHSNLGDMAQHYCIKNWIKENYPNAEIIMFESSVITDDRYTSVFFNHLNSIFDINRDRIVIQSGYCTQDLGGDHPLMHRLICDYMSQAKILMMPQTIFFKKEENKKICAENHNKAKRMLFLARDHVSYKIAKEMFTELQVMAFPDIVTTLIGNFKFKRIRKGVCLCMRNDEEKYYSDEELNFLVDKIRSNGDQVLTKDTQSNASYIVIRENLKTFIETEIESYSNYEVTITDRYHGTIFSLCAGTPVIIIKTTDHKVITGADWFKGIYDNYIYVAEDLDDAYDIYLNIKKKNLEHVLSPYMKENYYDKLKAYFEEVKA